MFIRVLDLPANDEFLLFPTKTDRCWSNHLLYKNGGAVGKGARSPASTHDVFMPRDHAFGPNLGPHTLFCTVVSGQAFSPTVILVNVLMRVPSTGDQSRNHKWLAEQRSVFVGNSRNSVVAGRSSTRLNIGRPHVRWQEGHTTSLHILEHRDQTARGNNSLSVGTIFRETVNVVRAALAS